MWQVIGQPRVVSLLQRSLERDSLAHAYLVVGPPHVGKMTLALNLAQALNCLGETPPCTECDSCLRIASGKHADVQVISLDLGNSAEIGIDRIKEVQHASNLPPFEGRHKVFIIDGAEFLSNEAANCLLKTLEEPVAGVVFILLTADSGMLPATVVSRCQRLDLYPLPVSEVANFLSQRGTEPEKAKLLARLSHGCLGWALSAAGEEHLLKLRAERLDDLLSILAGELEVRFDYVNQLVNWFGQNRGLVWEVLGLWLDFWRDLLLVKLGLEDEVTNIDYLPTLVDLADGYSLEQIRTAIAGIQGAGEQLKQNANPRLVFEVLMLNILPGRAI